MKEQDSFVNRNNGQEESLMKFKNLDLNSPTSDRTTKDRSTDGVSV